VSSPLILIVEDEMKIAEVIRDYLNRFGFKTSWLTQGDTVIPFVYEFGISFAVK